MFALLQIYPLEANADDGSDDNCCLDVIAIDPRRPGSSGSWPTMSLRTGRRSRHSTPGTTTHPGIEEHDRTHEECRATFRIYGALVRETRFKIVEVAVDRRPVSG